MRSVFTQGPGDADGAEIDRILVAEGLSPYQWSNGPHATYSAHSHGYHKVIYCLNGGITFIVADERFEMKPGDRLDIDPQTMHSAVVGPDGVVCVEAPRHK